jgi:hypothetical protein
VVGRQTLLRFGDGREHIIYVEILGAERATSTPGRAGRKTGITRVVPALAG